jgi:uncharacterized membrane protein
MMLRSYQRRLQDDLARWTASGLIGVDQAAAIRREMHAGSGGARLVGVLAMLGSLLLAAGVAAFIAANWQDIPRPVKVAGIAALVVAGLVAWAWLQRGWANAQARGGPVGSIPLPADAAATFAALTFAVGVALVGQMYHLPAQWLAGTLTVSIGALVVAALTRSDGALLAAMIGVGVWGAGHVSEGLPHPALAHAVLVLLLLGLAVTRERGIVRHAAVLSLGLWLALLPGVFTDARFTALLAYWLGVGVAFAALGLLGEQRGGPGAALASAALPWGVAAVGVIGLLQLLRILDDTASRGGEATGLAVAACAVAVASLAALVALGRDRRANAAIAAAFLALLALPALFWSGAAVGLAGRVVVGVLVLTGAILMVIAGGGLGQRRIVGAGIALFGAAVLMLLYRTVGSLVDQSLFFLVGGLILVGSATLVARLMKRRAAQGGG